MARQTGELQITGTIDGICFYKMYDRYYVRMKSSLAGKRFRKDKAFEGSRRSAERFALGNRVASEVYRMVAEEERAYQLFCFLKNKSIALCKEGRDEKEIKRILIELLGSFGLLAKRKKVYKERKKVCTQQSRGLAASLFKMSEPRFGEIRRLAEKKTSYSRKSINPPKSWFRQ